MTRITLLDGGMSRELQRCGAVLRQPEWSALALIEAPEAVDAAHRAFLEAGAQVITTNSYAVVPFHLGEARFAAEGQALAARAAQLAKAAAADHPGARVAGCLPPVCGSYQPENFSREVAAPILQTLVSSMAADVDLWLGETLSSLDEARTIAEATAGTGKPLWLSFTLKDGVGAENRAPVLRSGESVEEAAVLARELGVEGLLFNCSMPEVMEPAILAARAALGDAPVPIGVYANALVSQDEDGAANEVLSKVRDDLTPTGYLDWADRWVAAGASLIGGCCGINSPHIAELSAHFAPAS
ncbi:homocysteine S-methyltransferase family protein [Pseudoroseicyclus aestuarii]|uniref:Homocysteine S-methyltransferase n=1 Tax=Pseudoroseicyclus aestuarii TaxID=1795041 RepID=A0A318ST29_9RHOB|nr:homocysteine S-methyltransferase family protein [Pseudoroseicyclus aestuarii]PYE84863.1 homocysteine S-methyltransferase [Pseudoroseicyclus aestuarii]